MAIAQLIKKNDRYICSACRATQHNLEDGVCEFCGASFSNYIEIMTDIFMNEIKLMESILDE